MKHSPSQKDSNHIEIQKGFQRWDYVTAKQATSAPGSSAYGAGKKESKAMLVATSAGSRSAPTSAQHSTGRLLQRRSNQPHLLVSALKNSPVEGSKATPQL
jgi:hypothetical protein